MSKLSEALLVVSCIDADAYSAGTYLGDAVDIGSFDRLLYVLTLGDMAGTSTVDYRLDGSTATGGTYYTLTKAATQLTQAGSDDNKQVVIEVTAAEVKAAGYQFVKDRLLVATAASDAGSIGFGYRARYEPGTDLASVDEIV